RTDETKRYIADLGAAWSEERVCGVSTTSGTAQAVQSWINQLDVAKQAKQRAEDDRDQSVQEAESNRIELADLEKRGFNIENRAKPNHAMVKLLRDWLKVHERLAEKLERRDIARVLHENEHGVSVDSGTLSVLPTWVFALLGLLVLVVGSLFVVSSDFIAAMAVTILGCPAVILLWLQRNRTLAQIETEKRAASRREKQLDDELKKQQNRVDELERELQRLSSRLPDEIAGKKEEVADYLDSIETAIDNFMNNQHETEQWLALRNQVQRDQQVLAKRKDLLAKKTREYEDLDHRWEEWSRSNGFESSCTPYEIAMLLIDLRDARAHLQETDHAKKEYEKTKNFVQEAENNLAELLAGQGYP
ncbi:MAG: hypothetical protein KAI90_09160, partial [Desulfobulbaceae bacterium]|nr:hypothetical protein [Desulfobulbaceae bacterium]